MYGPCLCNEYIKGVDAFIDFVKKDMLDNIRGNICCPCKHCKNEKGYHTDDVLMSHLIKHGFMEDYRCWNKHREEGLNEAEMRDSYLEREDATGIEEDHDDDVNEPDILGFTDDDIEFQVHNIDEMICNVNKEFLTLLKDMLPQDNTVPETVCEAKQIICPLGLEVEKIHACKNNCILYRGPEYEDLEKCPICGLDRFNHRKDDGDDENCNQNRKKASLKRCFDTFLSFLV
jgi:hypothetical protein